MSEKLRSKARAVCGWPVHNVGLRAEPCEECDKIESALTAVVRECAKVADEPCPHDPGCTDSVAAHVPSAKILRHFGLTTEGENAIGRTIRTAIEEERLDALRRAQKIIEACSFDQTTHYVGCESKHPLCRAYQMLGDELRRLEEHND